MSKIVKVSKYVADKVSRKRSQFKVDTFRSGGKGGQNQNKVESGVRITDLVTGLSVERREERDQLQNKKNAFLALCDKLIEHYQKEEADLLKSSLGPPVKETIRSYRFTDNLVIDHRSGKKYPLARTLNGNIDGIIRDFLIDKS